MVMQFNTHLPSDDMGPASVQAIACFNPNTGAFRSMQYAIVLDERVSADAEIVEQSAVTFQRSFEIS
jgi:hypothetical protein